MHCTQGPPRSGKLIAIGRVADIYARVSPRLAGRRFAIVAARAHSGLMRRTGGKVGKRFLGAPVLVLRTTGRRSGEPRETPMFFVKHGDGFAVCASNAASERMPAWFLNLEAKPESDVLADGKTVPVRGRRATPEEEREVWPRMVDVYSGYDHYKSIATREMPVVILEPRA